MRKLILIILFAFIGITNPLNATIRTIYVSCLGLSNANACGVCGDTVKWIWNGCTDSIRSTIIPNCTTPWKSPINSTTPSYTMVLGCGGTYTYNCAVFSGSSWTNHAGTITVTCISGNANICGAGSTTLTVLGATSYTWSANAGSATTASVSVAPTNNTTYTVSGSNGSCTYTQTIMVMVNPLPSFSNAIANASCPTCNDGRDSVTIFPGNPPYQDNIDGGAFSWTDPFTNLSAGTHTVCIRDANNCMSCITFTIGVNSTGIRTSNATSPVRVYPNPSDGNFVIETNCTIKQAVQVYDISGKLVLSQMITGTATINATGLNEGVYTICITGNESVVNRRLVIVK